MYKRQVEDVQDKVEEMLIAADYAKTAKAYILYRAEHAKIRQAEGDLMDIYKELTFRDARDVDIKRENANIDTDTAMGTMLKYGSEAVSYTHLPSMKRPRRLPNNRSRNRCTVQ